MTRLSTPPNSQTSLFKTSDSTPVKADVTGSKYSEEPPEKAANRYKEMTYENYGYFVGPMPVDEFLGEFIPAAPAACPQGTLTLLEPTVSGNEAKFIDAVRTSKLCPHLHFLNSTNLSSSEYPVLLKPDIVVYLHAQDRDTQEKELKWGQVELWIENKPSDHDPFSPTNKKDRHIRLSSLAYETCGQLLSYAVATHRSQFRLFSYSLAFFGENARLFRWDRSGIIYTALFPSTGSALSEFLWRFNHLSAIDRGHDPSVSTAEGCEGVELALQKLKTRPENTSLEREKLHQILAWDDSAPTGGPRRYITPSATWSAGSFIGRATYGFVAYDVETGDLVYLKDFWRVDNPKIQKEGDIYRELHEHKVPHIAELGHAGDVYDHDSTLGGARSPQRTRTQDFVCKKWCRARPAIEPYVHYRLVLKTLGHPLHKFGKVKVMCQAIYNAIEAHTQAYEKAHILHRDVSAGNILITDQGTGLLIDWELSKKVQKCVDQKPRQHSRTGTWQFISISRLLNPKLSPHGVCDDLESFFWVLLYTVVRCRHQGRYSQSMKDVFDQHDQFRNNGSFMKGGKGKLQVLVNTVLPTEIVRGLTVGTPCADLIDDLRGLFRRLHACTTYEVSDEKNTRAFFAQMSEANEDVKAVRILLESSKEIMGIFQRHLNKPWNEDCESLDSKSPVKYSAGVKHPMDDRSGEDSGLYFGLKPNKRSRIEVHQTSRSSMTWSRSSCVTTSLNEVSGMETDKASPSESPLTSDNSSLLKV